MTSSTYYPELGGKPAANLIFAFHCINSTMSLRWKPEDDAKVRATFKSLRVRPRAIETYETIRGERKFSALCTYDAYRKLYEAGVVCREALLD